MWQFSYFNLPDLKPRNQKTWKQQSLKIFSLWRTCLLNNTKPTYIWFWLTESHYGLVFLYVCFCPATNRCQCYFTFGAPKPWVTFTAHPVEPVIPVPLNLPQAAHQQVELQQAAAVVYAQRASRQTDLTVVKGQVYERQLQRPVRTERKATEDPECFCNEPLKQACAGTLIKGSHSNPQTSTYFAMSFLTLLANKAGFCFSSFDGA